MRVLRVKASPLRYHLLNSNLGERQKELYNNSPNMGVINGGQACQDNSISLHQKADMYRVSSLCT